MGGGLNFLVDSIILRWLLKTTEQKKTRFLGKLTPKVFTQVGLNGTIARAVDVDMRVIRGIGLVTEAM